MDNLLAEFINETRDLVQQASQDFLKIEENPEDREIINSLFRAMHTIKGSSGVFELTPLTELVHEAENILDKAREGELVLTPDIIDVFLDILDQINIWMDELESQEKLGDDAEEHSKSFKEKLRAVTGNILSKKDVKEEDKIEESKQERKIHIDDDLLEYISKIPLNQRLDIIRAAPSWEKEFYLIVYQPDENCFFSGDDPILTMKRTPDLLGCFYDFSAPAEDEFDPYKCYLKFYIISSSKKELLEDHFSYVADETNIIPIPCIYLVYPTGKPISNEQLSLFIEDVTDFLEKEDFSSILQSVKVVKEIVSEDSLQYSALSLLEVGLSKSPSLPFPWVKALIEAIKNHKFEPPRDVSGVEKEKVEYKEKEKKVLKKEQFALIEDVIKKQIYLLDFKCDDNIKIGQLKSIKNVMSSILNYLGFDELRIKVENRLQSLIEDFSFEKAAEVKLELKNLLEKLQKERPEKGLKEDKKILKDAESQVQPSKVHVPQIKSEVKTLKVDQEQIDSLMDLVSELVVAKNALPYLAKRAEEEFQSRDLGKELKAQYGTINRICEDLQNVVMQIRMIPVSHVFQRFPRLVRDISRKLNKKVKLIIEGEDTRADKNVIEKMADPLVHLIRNSIDHGIEPPDVRSKMGKPEEGHIVLSASQLEDQVVIEVKDDGKGIDVDSVKVKAYEKGLISEEDMESMGVQEALELIFAPGISTAEKVSDISGRGVGMDAVRAMVEEVGGRVSITTEKGKGTTVRLSLPLSMAVTRILMIEVSGEVFGIPIENVSETVKVFKSDIHRVKDKEVIVLRERIIPLYRLKDILGLKSKRKEKNNEFGLYYEDEVSILILNLEKYVFGLVVDQFHEGIDIVLKPLEGFMEKFNIYSGATLLGDGRVLLVLNPKELLKWL